MGRIEIPQRSSLSFRSEAREASGSEPPRFHHAARRRGGRAAARGARAAAGQVPTIGIEVRLWQTVFASRQHGMCAAILLDRAEDRPGAGMLERGVRTTSIKQPCWARRLLVTVAHVERPNRATP